MNAETPNTFTDLELIEKYLEFKDHVDKETAAFEAGMKLYKDGMELIENVFLARLNERGADNTKTDAGTAYKSRIMKVKVADRDAYLKFCLDNWNEYGSDMLQVGTIKDPIKRYI